MKESNEVEIPRILYKYRCWGDNKHKRLLTNSEIFLSSVRSFNDPFEYTLPNISTPPTKEEMYTKIERISRYDNANLSEPEIEKLINERYNKFATTVFAKH